MEEIIFGKVAEIHKTKFNKPKKMKALAELKNALDRVVKKVMDNQKQGVKKLTNLAKLMKNYKKQLFTCVTHEGSRYDE